MDATGFNRDEIQPEMDLRKDLSIRSSRLPIIMDAAEHQFGIIIELEDFIDVRTVQDIAERIAKILAAQEGASLQPAPQPDGGEPVQDGILNSSVKEHVKRLVFQHVVVEPATSLPMELSPGESVLLLSAGRDDKRAVRVAGILRQDFKVEPLPMLFMPGNPEVDDEDQDIRTAEGAARAVRKIADLKALAGMVIILPQGVTDRFSKQERCFRGCSGVSFFFCKHFSRHRARNSSC